MENKKVEACKDEIEILLKKHGREVVKHAFLTYSRGPEPGSCTPPVHGCATGEIWSSILCKCVDDLGFASTPEE